jgi:hypothetical protein
MRKSGTKVNEMRRWGSKGEVRVGGGGVIQRQGRKETTRATVGKAAEVKHLDKYLTNWQTAACVRTS